ncbi:MAG: biotin transporter BioY [Alphaproteobacteria bacterium]|nr:biotin transporter BioY [Alphaproteobacteria bacterium]
MTAPVKLALQIAVGSATICALGPVELGWIEGFRSPCRPSPCWSCRCSWGRAGVAAVALYLALRFAGLPVFAGGTAGIEKLYGNTGGFLLAFLLGAALVAPSAIGGGPSAGGCRWPRCSRATR